MVRVPIRAGDCFMIDTMGLHRGVPPKQARRLMFSARYTAAGAGTAFRKTTENASAAQGRMAERSYALSAFRHKLGEVLDPEWFAADSQNSQTLPSDECHQDSETDVKFRLSALEQSVLDRTRRLTSLEIAAEGCVRRLLELERALSERKRDIASLETTIEERTLRLSALQDALDERTRRIAKLEIWRRAGWSVRDWVLRSFGRAA